MVVSGRRCGRSATETTRTSGRSCVRKTALIGGPTPCQCGRNRDVTRRFLCLRRSSVAAAIVRPCAGTSVTSSCWNDCTFGFHPVYHFVSNFTNFRYVPTPVWIVVYSGPRGIFWCSLNKYFRVWSPVIFVGFWHTFFCSCNIDLLY